MLFFTSYFQIPLHFHSDSNVYLPPARPYCASSIDIVVPLGQLNVSCSESHAALWYVRNVAASKAGK